MTHPEPPELINRNGERIVIFRNGRDGSFFSNDPDYEFALSVHQRAEREKAAAAEAAASETSSEVEDDEPVEADNGDGVMEYDEMKSADLIAEAKSRGLAVPSKTTRSALIEMLTADDETKATG